MARIMTKAIINADDFGWEFSCTKAIYQSFKQGLITDTTIMVSGKAFEEASEIINKDKEFGNNIGIHINLTMGEPLTENIRKCKRLVQNEVFTKYLVTNKAKIYPLSKIEKKAIYEEIRAQIKKCGDYGIKLTHADSHQHIHVNPQIIGIFLETLREEGIKRVRLCKNIVDRGLLRNEYYSKINTFIKRKGFITTDCFGNATEYSKLLPPGEIIEIMVHPDSSSDGILINRRISGESEIMRGDDLFMELDRIRNWYKFEKIHYSDI